MDSPRKLIRHAVKPILEAAETVAWVELNRPDNLSESRLESLPEDQAGILVFNFSEEPRTAPVLGQEGRYLKMVIEARAGQKSPIDDLLDDISWECERLLLATPHFGLDTDLLQIEEIVFDRWSLLQDASGQLIHGAAATQLGIKYAYNPEADSSLTDFLRIHGTVPPNGALEDDAEEFRAELPQE